MKMSKTRIQHYPNNVYSVDVPSDPSAELANVEAEVGRVTVVLAGLLTRVNYLKAQINVSKSSFLRVLPSEIIAEIFTLCLDIPGPDEEPEMVDNTVPLKLGAVCNAFRTIAWSTPRLWATVVLDIRSSWKIATQAALLSDWLSRSGHLPLSIWLNSSDEVHWTVTHPELIFKVLNVFSNRWKYVDIRLPSSCYLYLPSLDHSLPILESLTLKPPGGQNDRSHRVEMCKAPNLKSITLQCLYLRSITFAWHLLTVLYLGSFYIDESLEIFRQAFNLMELDIRHILGGDDNHSLPSDPIVMSSLSSLTFVNDKGTDLSTMLDNMTLPALRRVSFSADNVNTYAPCLSLTRVIQRSLCPLESLSLKRCSVHDFGFRTLLSHIPSVKELCLEMYDTTTYTSEWDIAPLTNNLLQSLDPSFARANGLNCLLPNLEILTYTGLQKFDWLQMLRMVESRTVEISTAGSSSTAVIRSVDSVSTSVRLREVSLFLSLSTKEEVFALTPMEPPSVQDTGLKWRLETIVKE